MKTHDERRIAVVDRELVVSRLAEADHHVGYLVKEFFTEDGQRFYLVENRILDSGELKKYILAATPVHETSLVTVMRQALSEWARIVKGYERHLHSLDPVAIRTEQNRVNAPDHVGWGHVTCASCREVFALGYNRIFGDRAAEGKCAEMFERVLADEHKRGQLHREVYELGD